MEEVDDFEVVFGNNSNVAYEKPAANDIRQRRRSLENELFIDRLLKALGVLRGVSYISSRVYSMCQPCLSLYALSFEIVSRGIPREPQTSSRTDYQQLFS